jgi:hypothetical protein
MSTIPVTRDRKMTAIVMAGVVKGITVSGTLPRRLAYLQKKPPPPWA